MTDHRNSDSPAPVFQNSTTQPSVENHTPEPWRIIAVSYDDCPHYLMFEEAEISVGGKTARDWRARETTNQKEAIANARIMEQGARMLRILRRMTPQFSDVLCYTDAEIPEFVGEANALLAELGEPVE